MIVLARSLVPNNSFFKFSMFIEISFFIRFFSDMKILVLKSSRCPFIKRASSDVPLTLDVSEFHLAGSTNLPVLLSNRFPLIVIL